MKLGEASSGMTAGVSVPPPIPPSPVDSCVLLLWNLTANHLVPAHFSCLHRWIIPADYWCVLACNQRVWLTFTTWSATQRGSVKNTHANTRAARWARRGRGLQHGHVKESSANPWAAFSSCLRHMLWRLGSHLSYSHLGQCLAAWLACHIWVVTMRLVHGGGVIDHREHSPVINHTDEQHAPQEPRSNDGLRSKLFWRDLLCRE